MTDKIEEIRARHESVHQLIDYDPPRQMHDDREVLLAEVGRQREEIERLTRERDEARGEVEKLCDVGRQAMQVLVSAFNRIHPEPRTSDTELARKIDIILGKIRSAIVRAMPEAKP